MKKIISNLINPRWKHSEISVRLKAVSESVQDQEVLKKIVNTDESIDVCKAAVKKISDEDFLFRLVLDDQRHPVSLAALEAIHDPEKILTVCLSAGDKTATEALKMISDKNGLLKVAESAESNSVRGSAIDRIRDLSALLKLREKILDKGLQKRLTDRIDFLFDLDTERLIQAKSQSFYELKRIANFLPYDIRLLIPVFARKLIRIHTNPDDYRIFHMENHEIFSILEWIDQKWLNSEEFQSIRPAFLRSCLGKLSAVSKPENTLLLLEILNKIEPVSQDEIPGEIVSNCRRRFAEIFISTPYYQTGRLLRIFDAVDPGWRNRSELKSNAEKIPQLIAGLTNDDQYSLLELIEILDGTTGFSDPSLTRRLLDYEAERLIRLMKQDQDAYRESIQRELPWAAGDPVNLTRPRIEALGTQAGQLDEVLKKKITETQDMEEKQRIERILDFLIKPE